MTKDFDQLITQMRTQLQALSNADGVALNDAETIHPPLQQLNPQLMVEFVELLRPKPHLKPEVRHEQACERIEALLAIVERQPESALVLQTFVFRLINQYQQTNTYAVSGILSQSDFRTQLSHRVGEYFLPLLKNERDLRHLIGEIFHRPDDRDWLNVLTEEDWRRFLSIWNHACDLQPEQQMIQMEMVDAIMLLSYRISSIGLHPELIHAYPEIDEYESPFLVQNREIIEFIGQYKAFTVEKLSDTLPSSNADPAQALVMLDQCHDILLRIRRGTQRNGVSLNLTYLLVLLDQCLQRIEVLLLVLTSAHKQQQLAVADLAIDLVDGYYEDKSVRSLLSTNTQLIALQITENASRTGEHYVSVDKKGFSEMYQRAAGAGAIIAFMATLKILMSKWQLAPLMQAISYSLNYGIGFVVIHMLHCTVATKQPAMTAAALAATIQHSKGRRNAQLAGLAVLIINMIRTQFVAILGNISIAMPIAALIALAWPWLFGTPLITHDKATHLLHDINPLTSLALPHAAIAGVCLFLSGLITGYYDNLAVYRNVGARIEAHPVLKKYFRPERLTQIAHYIEKNLGAIMGNFLFGCMLGSIGTIGVITGLPLDIRHIAFASANYIQGLMHINGGIDIAMIIIGLVGVLLIGLTNLVVSFGLTIIVALRARRVKVEDWKPLIKLIMTHFVTRPSDFFWPPKQPLQIQDK